MKNPPLPGTIGKREMKLRFYDLRCIMIWKYIGEEGCAHFINYWSDSKPYSLLFEQGSRVVKFHINLTNVWGWPLDISYYNVDSDNHLLNSHRVRNQKRRINQTNNFLSHYQYFESEMGQESCKETIKSRALIKSEYIS